MSPTATLNKIIELSSCEGDDFIEGYNNQDELELLHFFGLDEKKSDVSYEERFKKYNFFVKNFKNTELIEKTFSNEKIIELYDDYVTNYSAGKLEGVEIIHVSFFEAIGKNKQLFSKALFSSMNAYVSASLFLNESYAFRVYSLMSNLDFYEINSSKEGFLEFFTEDYDNLDIDEIFINLKDDKVEIRGIDQLFGRKKERNITQINNEKILDKFETGIFHLARYFDDIDELKKIHSKLLLLENTKRQKIWNIINIGGLKSKNDVYKILDILEYLDIFITKSQRKYFTIDWFLGIDDSEKEFIKQSIQHLKDGIIKYKTIPENLKNSVYLVEMISGKSKKEVIEIMDLDREIPKLKEVFTEKFSEKILIRKESNLSIAEKNIINSFLLKYIKGGSGYRETNDMANHIFFEEIDEYLEGVLFNLQKYNQEHTDTFKLIQTYLDFDIDKTNLSDSLAILGLLTRHFKDKKLKEFLSKIILNEIYLISPHLKEFFSESMVDDLDGEKYIGPIGELLDEIRLYSEKIEKDIINSELNHGLFLTDKDNEKIEKTGKGISISNEIFNLIYKNLNFKILEDSLFLKKRN